MLFKMFLCAMLFLGALPVRADGEQPSWFVVKDKGSLNAEVVTETAEAVKDEKKTDTEKTQKEEIFAQVPAADNIRFARNNKDLMIAGELLKFEFRNNSERNIAVSPLSLYTTSILLANGVVDETLSEFSKLFSVLHLSDANKQISKYLDAKEDSIQMYNSLWGKYFSEHYQRNVKEQLKAEIWGLNGSIEPINNWINVRSKGKISKMVSDGEAKDDEIVFANAVYFYNKWQIPFNSKDTVSTDFYNLDGKKSSVMMMYQQADAEYFEDETMQALRLFYDTGDYVTIFLPKEKENFDDFVNDLDFYSMKPSFKQVKNVQIYIPRFDIEYNISSAKGGYQLFGVKQVFAKDNYDFAKMVSYDMPVNLKNVYLKTKVVIDENEDEASEEAKSVDKSPEDSDLTFKADHPFVFMINNGDFIGTFVRGVKKSSL